MDPSRINQLLAQSQKVGSQSAAGHSGALAKKTQLQNKPKVETPKLNSEASMLSEAAQKALEQEKLDQATSKGQESVKNQGAGQTKRRLHDDEDDKKVGTGVVKEKPAGRVFQLDDDAGESYEVSEAQGQAVDNLDRKTPEQILSGMPEGARKAAAATLDTQIKTKGTDKIADLKDDPKISAVAEQLDLDPVESLKDSAKVAPIRDAKNEPPMMVEDTQSESMVKEAAKQQLASGAADEAMIA